MRPPSDFQPSGALDLDALDAAGLESRIERAEIALLFERTRTSNWIALPVGLLLCWLLWNVVPQATLLGWLTLKYVAAFVRLGIAWRYRHDGPAHELRWGSWYERALVVEGAVYGLIGTVLLPPGEPEAAALMLATVIGVAAIGLIVLSVRPFACLGFCLPVLLPPIVYQLSMGTRLSLYAALAMAIFLGLIVGEGRRAAATTRIMLRLRFEMAIVAD